MKIWAQKPLSEFLHRQMQVVSGKISPEEVPSPPINESYFLSSEKGLSFFDQELGELHLDFLGDRVHYARQSRKGKAELIAKAVGLAKGTETIFDATLGLAQDAWFLTRLGAKVAGCERSPVLYLLLQDALQRARQEFPQVTLEIYFANAIDFLKTLETRPQVIYLDPMFPEKKKSALPRKEMRIFRKLVGDDLDAQELLEVALKTAIDRVVVKRPLRSSPLREGVMHSFAGTTVKYDLYSIKAGL